MHIPQMAKASRGAPSSFDILMDNFDSEEDATITRDNFELSTAELQEHYSLPNGMTKWMKENKRTHTVFFRYQSTNDIKGTKLLDRLQNWYINTAVGRYGSGGTTNTDLRKYLRRDMLGHNPPDYKDKRCWDVYNSTQVVTVQPTAPAQRVTRSRTRAPSAALPDSGDEDTTTTVVPTQTAASYSKSDFLRTLEMIQRHVYCFLRRNVSRFLDDTCKNDLTRWIADKENSKADLTDENRLDVPSRSV